MQLTSGRNERHPQCSPDGKWVYFVEQTENQALKRVPLDGGNAGNGDRRTVGWLRSFTRRKVHRATRCARTRSQAGAECFRPREQEDDVSRRRSARVGPDQLFCRTAKPFFIPCGRGASTICGCNRWTARAYRQLTHFTAERIARFKVSFDGSQIAIERGHNESDAVLLRDTPK